MAIEVYQQKADDFFNEKHNEFFMIDNGRILFLDEVREPVGYYPLKIDTTNNMKAGSVIVDIIGTLADHQDRLSNLSPNTLQGALFLMLTHTAAIALNQAGDKPISITPCLTNLGVRGYTNKRYNDQMARNPRIEGAPAGIDDFRSLSQHFKEYVRGLPPVGGAGGYSGGAGAVAKR